MAAAQGATALMATVPRPVMADTVDRSAAGQTREYWIQADSMLWNLVPNGRDDFSGTNYTADQTSFVTVGYRAYSPNWATLLPSDSIIGENTGIPGPVIRARAGDTLVVHLKNNDVRPKWAAHSLHMQGLVRDVDDDAFWHGSEPNLPGTAIYPGESYTYRYVVPQSAVGTWLYYDYSASRRSKGRGFDIRIYRDVPIYTRARPQDPEELDAPVGAKFGLFGMLIIDDVHMPPVDRENIVLFHDLYSDELPMLIQDFDCVNGRSFLSNTPTFQARVG